MDKILYSPSEASPNSGYVSHELITQRARELWETLGCPEGRDEEIWLQAERELRATAPTSTPDAPSLEPSKAPASPRKSSRPPKAAAR